MKKNIMIYTLCIILLSACAQPTGYVKRQPQWGIDYGYHDKKIGDDEFAIIAEGNVQSSMEHVAKLALYHAAHVTIENGKEFFQILQKSDQYLPSHQTIFFIAIPVGLPSIIVPVVEAPTDEATSILIIRITDDEETSSSRNINALQVINELEPIFEGKK